MWLWKFQTLFSVFFSSEFFIFSTFFTFKKKFTVQKVEFPHQLNWMTSIHSNGTKKKPASKYIRKMSSRFVLLRFFNFRGFLHFSFPSIFNETRFQCCCRCIKLKLIALKIYKWNSSNVPESNFIDIFFVFRILISLCCLLCSTKSFAIFILIMIIWKFVPPFDFTRRKFVNIIPLFCEQSSISYFQVVKWTKWPFDVKLEGRNYSIDKNSV